MDTHIKLLISDFLALSLACTICVSAHTDRPEATLPDALDLASVSAPDSLEIRNYDKRLHRYRKSWGNLIPTHLKCQYAGDIGFISIGAGWDYGHHSQWETDALFGYLPKYDSAKSKFTFTLKQNYLPWSLTINNRFSAEPLSCGLFLNSVLNNQFWYSEPDRYPKGYYNFNLRVRIHIFLGQRFTYTIPRNRRLFCKSITAYYEVSTCDLYVASAFTNRYLKLKDIICLGMGVKVQIF
jgi:hypothetical protein